VTGASATQSLAYGALLDFGQLQIGTGGGSITTFSLGTNGDGTSSFSLRLNGVVSAGTNVGIDMSCRDGCELDGDPTPPSRRFSNVEHQLGQDLNTSRTASSRTR
jgi:hypothetical protein